MATIAFIGLGNMGAPMARNLLAAGHAVTGFDLSETARADFSTAGGGAAATLAEAVERAEVVVSALPAAAHVRASYLAHDGVLAHLAPGGLCIDCSTIDVATAREVIAAAAAAGGRMVDSPMSGGVAGAEAGTLTFMVGGDDAAMAAARPVLAAMGRNIFHAGGPGAGCAAKICNNLMLGIQMIGVAEGFNLAVKLGLEPAKLYEISSTATARCWSLTDYCPAPGLAPNAPSNRDYAAGFAAALMLKDLRLAMEAAQGVGVVSPLGAEATQIYGLMDLAGQGGRDFSGVIKLLQGDLAPA